MVDPKGYLTDLNSITPQTSGDIKLAGYLDLYLDYFVGASPHSQVLMIVWEQRWELALIPRFS